MRQNLELRSRFKDELQSKTLLMLTTSEKEQFECQTPPFGEEVAKNFPSASDDLKEASRCLALERYTACVYHLMCAFASPLAVLAKHFGVTMSAEWDTWGQILTDIENKIRAMPHTTPTEKTDQQYYSQLAAQFWLIKDAHRNPVMHGRGRCGHEEAVQIWNGTEVFMQKLAERLHE